MTDDSYLTLASPATAETRELGSKFLGYAFPLAHFQEWQQRLLEIKEMHPKATHHCYAYTFGGLELRERTSDDGEPTGSAGKPILGQIVSFGLSNVIVIVVRYFGGKKLGIPGLIQSYRECTKATLSAATIKMDHFMDTYILEVSYCMVPGAMQYLKNLKVKITGSTYTTAGQIIEFQARVRERSHLERSIHTEVGGLYPDEWDAGQRVATINLTQSS